MAVVDTVVAVEAAAAVTVEAMVTPTATVVVESKYKLYTTVKTDTSLVRTVLYSHP